MKRRNVYIAAGLFLALTMVKLLAPSAVTGLKAQAARLLGGETDLRPVFEAIGEKLSLGGGEEKPEEAAPSPTPETREVLRPVTLAARPELAAIQGERPPAEPAAGAQPELPEAVTAFLKAQEAFADYEIPDNVSYSYSVLPFDYAVPVAGYESSGFGYRVHPILGDVRFHYGTDLAAWTGEAVLAFTSGTVVTAAWSDSYGNYVVIDHGDGWESLYAHCSSLLVTGGQWVETGETIALVGETGLATGPHLHFELTHDGVYLNPEYYINDR
ncbi:MAG: peptidoglycan DD-metalloendopeptidase family protein [Oscillospiraceae bacterium]